MAELVDALASGASGLTAVKVRVLSWAPFLLKPMISLKGGLFDPLTGTQNRDTARISYRMSHIYQDSDSSFWNFRTRTPSDVLRILDNDRALLVFDTCMGNPGFQVKPTNSAHLEPSW